MLLPMRASRCNRAIMGAAMRMGLLCPFRVERRKCAIGMRFIDAFADEWFRSRLATACLCLRSVAHRARCAGD